MKIISGGQTGIDRAALDVALELGVEAGGWCPEDRAAEDGIIPESYPVQELPNSGYRQRTKRNVVDSDGTIIIYFSYPTGGTEQTIEFCIKEHKPYLLIDADSLTFDEGAKKGNIFIQTFSIQILNVAGSRQSREKRAYPYAKNLLFEMFKS